MLRAALLFHVAVAWLAMSVPATACSYPLALQVVNKALIDQIDRGGEVSIYTRTTLRRALDRVPADAIVASLKGEVSRGELRAVRKVLEVAAVLADGRGRVVDPNLRDFANRVKSAVNLSCAAGTLEGAGTADATTVEHGGARKDGQFARALTFKEGLTRLSIAFTLYAVFLIFLFAFRQAYRQHAATHLQDKPAAPPHGVSAPLQNDQESPGTTR